MKIKKKKEKPILKRARRPAEAAAETRFKKILKPFARRWKLIVAVTGGVVLVGAAIGGYAWYRHDRELRAADAYAGIQERLAGEARKAAEAAGAEGQIDKDDLLAKTATELENLIDRFGDTGTGRAAAYELASLYFDRGEYGKARSLFAEVEGKSKGLEKVLAGIGVADCDKATGDYEAAIAKYRQIFDDHRGEFPSVPVAMNLAECYRETGKLDEAAKTYRYVIDYHRLSPYAPEAERGLSETEALIAGKAGTL